MPYLLDSHTVIWFYEGSPQISDKVKDLVCDPANSILVSSASLWEIAIKISIGKLRLSISLETLVEKLESDLIGVVAPAPKHILSVISLPFHHRDPFDRMLVAQALAEGYVVLFKDTQLDISGVQRLW